jgi:hypothetical protein
VTVDGREGFVVESGARDAIQNRVSAAEDLENTLARMDQLVDSADAGNLDAQRRLSALKQEAMQKHSVMAGGGQVGKEEAERYGERYGSAQDMLGSRASAKSRLAETRAAVREGKRKFVENAVYGDPDAASRFYAPNAGGLRRE